MIGTTSPFTTELPAVQSVAIAPDNAADATQLTATPVSTDPGGAAVSYTYQWLENGNTIAGATSQTFAIPAGVVPPGAQFSSGSHAKRRHAYRVGVH